MGYVYLKKDGYIPDHSKEVAVFIEGPGVKGWYAHPRLKGDRLGKKHLNTFKDDEGNVIGHAWLTSEQRLKGFLLKGQTLKEYRELQKKYDPENVIE